MSGVLPLSELLDEALAHQAMKGVVGGYKIRAGYGRGVSRRQEKAFRSRLCTMLANDPL